MPLLGLHHLTATVDQARPDLAFYRDLLGLRLVKRTVNFDNHFVYHFYYGDDLGSPSTIMTTFPYHGWKVAEGVKGAGQITVTAFSVPPGSLPAWATRLRAAGFAPTAGPARFGSESLVVADPSGLAIELLEQPGDSRTGWTEGPTDRAIAIRGLAAPTLAVRRLGPSLELVTEVLGFEVVAEAPGRTLVAAGRDAPGHRLEFLETATGPDARNGIGTVHHVALAIPTAEEQLALRGRLVARGLSVTQVLDRKYFRSIYFREPGGILYEVATAGPGFAIDEPPPRLGEALMLPDHEEPHRDEIERRLPPID